jgi:polysaccharide export outer membrane protein
MKSILLASCLGLSALTGCSTLPSAGPTTSEVVAQAAKEGALFHLVEIDPHVVSILESQPRVNVAPQFASYGKPPSPTVAQGDSIAVRVWRMEPGAANPIGESGGVLVIPEQMVDIYGAISIPFVGQVTAAGRTPLQIQRDIERRLGDTLIQPQAIVTVTQSSSDFVTVFGEEFNGARVRLPPGGGRLLDIIGAAGGSKNPIRETSVRVLRNGATMRIPMATLVSDPKANIYAWPGDVIAVEHTPKKFQAFGATSLNSSIPIDSDRLDLAQAIAKAGGLIDQRADPEGVFLFRFESANVVQRLGLRGLGEQPPGETPVVYHLDLRQMESYFLAKRFAVAEDDMIYAANAQLTQLQKFFSLIGTVTAPVTGAVVLSRGVGN